MTVVEFPALTERRYNKGERATVRLFGLDGRVIRTFETSHPKNFPRFRKNFKLPGTFPLLGSLIHQQQFALKQESTHKGQVMNKPNLVSISFVIAVAAVLAASAVSGHAQGETASGTVSGVQSGSDFIYTITLDNTSDSVSIASLWYAWIPGVFYLPGVPISASAPAGWTASIFANSVQYFGGTLAPGASINFSYVATFAPSALTGFAGYSYVYHSGLDSDPSDGGNFLNVQTVAAPEPSSTTLFVAGAFGLLVAGWRKFCAQ